jgi:hypothetical protein
MDDVVPLIFLYSFVPVRFGISVNATGEKHTDTSTVLLRNIEFLHIADQL